MRTALLASWTLSCVALVACVDTPSEDSADCVEHADCGGCGRCVNGQCVEDELGFAQTTCDVEEKDPCNGVDDDGDGVIDDPDSCWVAIREVVDPATGARCLVSDDVATPAACETYQAVSSEPAFFLAKQPIPGTVAVRQCVSASDAVLLSASSSQERSGAAPSPVDPPASAYEALGYVCGEPLGYTFVAPTPDDEQLGQGRRCPLYEFVRAPDDGDFGAHRYYLGPDAADASGACDPRATRYVATPRACDAAPPASCAFGPYSPKTEATLLDPPERVMVEPNAAFDVTFTLRNTGDTTWEPGWILVRTEHLLDQIPLEEDVPPGDEVTFSVTNTAPEYGVELVDHWSLRSLDGAVVPIVDGEDDTVAIHYTVNSTHAAHRVSLDPPFKAHVPTGASFDALITLENVGRAPWGADWRFVRDYGTIADVGETTLGEDVVVGGEITLRIPMQLPADIFGGFNERWRLLDGDGRVVPIDDGADVWIRVHVVNDDIAKITSETIPDETVVVPGSVFIKTWTFRNVGVTTWDTGWSFRRVDGELGLMASSPIESPVPPGSELTLAVPMFVPDDGGRVWRESWKLVNADGTLVPVTGDSPNGGEFIGASPDWWFWAEVYAETPCLSAPVPQ